MPAVIRAFKKDDFPAWRKLYAAYMGKRVSANKATEVFRQTLTPKSVCKGLIAVDGDKAIGFVHLIFHQGFYPGGTVCYVEDLFVAPAARRHGIARQLLDAAFAAAEKKNCTRIYWTTDPNNKIAQKLYKQYASGTPTLRYTVAL